MALCLLAVYIICYFSLWKGISTSGKVVWFTALFPYAVLLILLVRGITLPGSADGIKYYLNPNFNAITSAEVSFPFIRNFIINLTSFRYGLMQQRKYFSHQDQDLVYFQLMLLIINTIIMFTSNFEQIQFHFTNCYCLGMLF